MCLKNICKQSADNGFTLVELLVICLLFSLLAALGFYIFRHFARDETAMARQQNLQSVAGDLMRHLRKDLRSATATNVATQSILIKIVRLNQEEIPEEIQVSYVFKNSHASRISPNSNGVYNFADFLQKNEKLRVIIQKNDKTYGLSLQIGVADDNGKDILKIKEQFSIANQQFLKK